MVDIRFRLKTAAPRIGQAAPARTHLERRWAEANDRTAIIVTAPQGFGKTTLLARWRRNWLEQGAFVAWASLDAQDDGARFVDLLLFSLRAATGRESFALAATQSMRQANRELEALTTLLAEILLLAKPTVIILDDVHRMPRAPMQELLAYLLNNAPPNLHFLVSSRRPLDLQVTDLMAAGRVATFEARDLRLALDESVEILRARFGSRIGLDDAVHLHDLTEGWPLGLQLAASAIERADDLHEVITQLSARRGDIQRYFFDAFLSQLPQAEAEFLVRISILETVNAEVADVVTGCREAATFLETLARDSPIVTEGEARAWLRLHAMARDFLLGQFDKLPVDERRTCYERAAAWYAAHQQWQDAARHALAAGNDELAITFALKCLLDIAREGRLAEARDWMRRLPAHVVSRDVHLQLLIAWVTALGEDAAAAPSLVEQAARHPQFDAFCRFEGALVKAASAAFCDQPGLLAEALEGWDQAPREATPMHCVALANSQATLAVDRGDTERARQVLAAVQHTGPREPALRLPLGLSDMLIGLSQLLEGNPAKALAVLQPSMDRAERELGRRSSLAALLAGPLAAALFLQDAVEPALATLADRLDVIERGGMPDPIILAYRTLAMIALRRGDEARELDVLAALRELGAARAVPRMSLVSLAEQVRVYAQRRCVQTASELHAELAALRGTFEQPPYRPMLWHFHHSLALATGWVCLARTDLAGAETAFRAAAESTSSMRRSPLTLRARALQALVARDLGRPEADDMLAEVLSLADLAGMRPYVAEAHPRLAAVSASVTAADGSQSRAGAHGRAVAQSAAGTVRVRVVRAGAASTGGLLTLKEGWILSLLAAGRANKEIARAMDVGEQTVKWHLKNVFFKLNAANRKHAVDRARLLGLLDG